MIRAVPLALLMLAGRVEALEMPSGRGLVPALVMAETPPGPPQKSPWLALGLSAATELPTLLIGPSLGHLYAGETAHFWITGGARLGALGLLYLLEAWGPGIGPLYAVGQPGHLGASFNAYPAGFTLDLLLVLGIIGSAIYDLVDAPFAAVRFNDRFPPQPVPAQARWGPAAWPLASF